MMTSRSDPIYRDKRGKFRWRLKSSNGEIVGASSQGFSSPAKAQDNMDLLFDLLGHNIKF